MQEAQDNPNYKDFYIFKHKKTISFPLDSSTSGSGKQTYIKNKKFLVLNDYDSNNLHFYNISNNKLEKIIRIKAEGNEGIGQANGFFIHTLDSIFAPSFEKNAIYLLNQEGKILEKYPFDAVKNTISFNGMLSEPFIFDNRLYCPTMLQIKKSIASSIKDLKQGTFMQILDLKTKKWSSDISPPDLYQKGFFGSPNFYNAYHAFNPTTKKLYMGFAIDENVYEYDMNTIKNIKKYYAGGKNIGQAKPSSMLIRMTEEESKIFAQNPSYNAVVYDPYRKMYYRVAQKPISDIDLKSTDMVKRNWKQFSFIILDEKLNKVGEVSLPKYEYGSAIIPTEEGILIANVKKNKTDENNMYYDLFEVVEKK